MEKALKDFSELVKQKLAKGGWFSYSDEEYAEALSRCSKLGIPEKEIESLEEMILAEILKSEGDSLVFTHKVYLPCSYKQNANMRKD